MIYRWLGRLTFILLYPIWRIKLTGSKRAYLLLIGKDNQLLFVKNWLGNGRWQLPGGGLRRGESHKSGLTREVREELRVNLDTTQLKHLTDGSHRGCKYAVYSCRLHQALVIKPNKLEIVDACWSAVAPKLPLEIPAARALEQLKPRSR